MTFARTCAILLKTSNTTMNKQNLDQILIRINDAVANMQSKVYHTFDSDYHSDDLRAETKHIVDTIKSYGLPEWSNDDIPEKIFESVWGIPYDESISDEEFEKLVESQEYKELLHACNIITEVAASLVESENIEEAIYEGDMDSTQRSVWRWVING